MRSIFPYHRQNSKISSTLRERIEGNIENRNCYCIWIDYDDDNKEEEEEEEGEEEAQEEGVLITSSH